MNKKLLQQLFAFSFVLLVSFGCSQKIHAQAGPENCDPVKQFCRLLTPGSKGEDVVRLKQYLKKIGRYANDITSDNYNGLVKLRVSELQIMYGLTPTGNLNSLIRAIINGTLGDTAEKTGNRVALGEYKDLITTAVKLNASHTLVGTSAKTAWFEYAESEQSLNDGTGFHTQQETLNPEQKDFGAQLTGLKKGAFYWYRAVVSDGGVVYKSDIASLKTKQGVISGGGGSSHNTPPPQYAAPTTSLVGVTNITSSSADISVNYVISGGLSTTVTYTVGTNQSLNTGNEIIITHTLSNASGTDIANLSGLSSSSTYYFTVTATNSSGAASVINGTFVTGFHTPSFYFSFGTSGSNTGQFLEPTGLALDSHGNLYVADSGNNRIQKFDQDGVYISEFGTYGTALGQFNTPDSLEIDQVTGDIYVSDENNSRVQKFDSSGNPLSEFGSLGSNPGEFYMPGEITINSSRLYVSDRANHRIQIFDMSGHYISEFGSSGSGPAQFGFPQGTVFDSSNNIFVVETGNTRVQKLSPTFHQLLAFGVFGIQNLEFRKPNSVDVDIFGNLYITDTANDRVQIVSQSGTFISKFGQTGFGSGDFRAPWGIVINRSNGYVYVSDFSNDRIQIFR